jgi:hypothetical protein
MMNQGRLIRAISQGLMDFHRLPGQRLLANLARPPEDSTNWVAGPSNRQPWMVPTAPRPILLGGPDPRLQTPPSISRWNDPHTLKAAPSFSAMVQ